MSPLTPIPGAFLFLNQQILCNNLFLSNHPELKGSKLAAPGVNNNQDAQQNNAYHI